MSFTYDYSHDSDRKRKILNTFSLKHFPDLANNKRWCLHACRRNGKNYKYVGEKFKEDVDIISIALANSYDKIHELVPKHLIEECLIRATSDNILLINKIENPSILHWKVVVEEIRCQGHKLEDITPKTIPREILIFILKCNLLKDCNYDKVFWIYKQIADELMNS